MITVANPLKQAGGSDLVIKLIAALTLDVQHNGVALVDAHGYDAFPALASVEVIPVVVYKIALSCVCFYVW